VTAPAVTVVIPTHNRRDLLTRTLRSVLSQRGSSFEVLIVDDGSSDDTAEVVESLGDSRVGVLRNVQPCGVAAARNRGLEQARGRWVAFTDDDDLWAPDKLEQQLRAAESHPEAGWVCVGALTVDENLRVIGGKRPPSAARPQELLCYNRIPGGGSGTMIRTDIAREIGGFDPDLSNLADWDMWIRVSDRAPLTVVDRPLLAYLRHPASLSHDSSQVREEFAVIERKHAGLRAAHGVSLGPNTLRWFAQRHTRSGQRRPAVELFVHVAREYGDRKSWVRALLAGLCPRWLGRRWDRRMVDALPQGWLEEGERWLAPYRSTRDSSTAKLPAEPSAHLQRTRSSAPTIGSPAR
jgi:glycosyltransferase involved in cell wall biosynthesis